MKQVIAAIGMLLALTAAVQAKTCTGSTHHRIGFSANDVADAKGF